jgi:hypothetical protein
MQERYKPGQKLEGLGDLIAMITYYTKLDLLVSWFSTKILKKDCGCTRRKKTLNKKFKFK